MSVAYASGSGFAASRNFKQSDRRREERAIAHLERCRENQERHAFQRNVAPKHCRGLEPFSREWFEACDRAFQNAMEAAGYERRIGSTHVNAIGSTR